MLFTCAVKALKKKSTRKISNFNLSCHETLATSQTCRVIKSRECGVTERLY